MQNNDLTAKHRFETWPWSNLVHDGSAAGSTRDGLSLEKAILTWTDSESGERLTVAVEGTAPFLRSLELEGFERLATEEADPLRGSGSGTEERPGTSRFGDRARSGSVPLRATGDGPDSPPRVAS